MLITRDFALQSESFPIMIHRGYDRIVESYPYHTHQNFNEIVIVLGGTAQQNINATIFNSIPGDVYIFHAEDHHGFEKMRNWSSVTIGYDVDMLAQLSPFMRDDPLFNSIFIDTSAYPENEFGGFWRFPLHVLEEIRERTDILNQEYTGRVPGYKQKVWAGFVDVCVSLFRAMNKETHEKVKTLDMIGDAIMYVEENFYKKIQIEQLAELSNMSVSTLIRAFKKVTGMTPNAYILHRRLAEACHLLRTTYMSVTEIAYQTGFNDSSYFTRQFKKVFETTPFNYRRSQPHSDARDV